MALLATMTKEQHTALGEDSTVKDLYAEKDGKFVLDVTPADGFELAQVAKLRTALEKERGNAETANKKLQIFGDLDPKSARDAMKKVDEIKDFNPDEKIAEGIKAREKQLLDAHALERESLQKSNTGLLDQLRKSEIVANATKAIAEQGGSIGLLLPIVESQTRLKHIEGKGYVPEVINADGHGRISGSDGQPMTIDQLVTEFKSNDVYAQAFNGTGHSGTGASDTGGDSSSAGTPHVISKADAKDTVKYRAAKAAAEKANTTIEIQGD